MLEENTKSSAMYHYIDESGHSGSKLFKDIKNQPNLYYGVLTAPGDLDGLITEEVIEMRKKVGTQRLHANHLGNGRLVELADTLMGIQNRLGLVFDFYVVKKRAHAEFCFFDQVFDSGMNDDVPYYAYWTPYRFVLLMEVRLLFNAASAERAWNIRVDTDCERAARDLSDLCRHLLKGIGRVRSADARRIIRRALKWAILNPEELLYNAVDDDQIKQIAPNIIGFQFVMHGIARRVFEEGKKSEAIIVDRQDEFNKAQQTLAEFFASAAGIEFANPKDMPVISFDGMPDVPLEFRPGDTCVGLELVDIYLWVFKRLFEGKIVANELKPLFEAQIGRGRYDEISHEGIMNRILNMRGINV
ncbi:DUF3800 domain-containing protein [Achromobacter xylosoxidans]|uniref:DUF3800 domain-containing protein n=1 Tax=Alcaligenes xylosoxydans xylosoxydans TaxID=85698 RepID=UPI001EEA8267|nr:DUF3800 domain-containing protein [Achromobacter xylosoxidans]